jgi:hypothetical protein
MSHTISQRLARIIIVGLALIWGAAWARAGNTEVATFTAPLSATLGGSGVTSPTAHGILLAEGSSAFSPLVLGAGQIPIGTTSSDPSAATLTAGTGISISSVTGSITISTSGASGTYTLSTKTTNYNVLAGDAGTLFLTTGASAEVDFTLPAASGTGHYFLFSSDAAQILKVIAGTGDKIRMGGQQTASAGNIATTTGGRGNCAMVIDISTNNWTVLNATGSTWSVN